MTRLGQTRSPDLAEVLRAAISAQLFDVHVALPAVIEKYDEVEQKVEVKPLLKRNVIFSDGTEPEGAEILPIITNVPVVFPRGGGFFVSLPLAPGDHVLLVFNERSIDKFLQGKGVDTDPIDVRMHDLSDAVAFAGFYPFGKSLADAHPDNMVLGKDGGALIHIRPDGQIHLFEDGAAEFIALATKTNERIATLEDSVKSLVNTAFNVHTHLDITPLIPAGTAPTLLPTPTATAPTTGSSVAAAQVKAT